MHKPVRKLISFASIVLMLWGSAAPAGAGAPADDLKQIEYKFYFRGKYAETIEALQTFLARIDVSGDVALRAQEFLAASHVLSGAPATGKDVFMRIIALDPAYAGPDPAVFKPEVVSAYAQARSDYAVLALKQPATAASDSLPAGTVPVPGATQTVAGKPIYKKWWFYAGAAAIVGVVAGVAASGGSDSSPAPTGSLAIGVNVK